MNDMHSEATRDPSAVMWQSATRSRKLVSASTRLLDVQYRLWERDLSVPELPLQKYGFRVSRDDGGIKGLSCRYDAADGIVTIIRKDKLLHGRPNIEGVAIDRRTLRVSTVIIHDWSALGRISYGAPTDAATSIPRLISWIGGYEQWIEDCGRQDERSYFAESLGIEGSLSARWWSLAADWRAALGGGLRPTV